MADLSCCTKLSHAFFQFSKPIDKNASPPPLIFSVSNSFWLLHLQYAQNTFSLVVHRESQEWVLYLSGENWRHFFPCSFLVCLRTLASVICVGSVPMQQSAVYTPWAESFCASIIMINFCLWWFVSAEVNKTKSTIVFRVPYNTCTPLYV